MQAARFHAPCEGLVVEEVPHPDIGPNEVLVRVGGAGICHSDLHIIEGKLPLTNLPVTLGHENAGHVEAVGDDVDSIDPGTPVAVYGGWGCGTCDVCARGQEQLCNIMEWVGIGHDGGYAEYLRVPTPRYLVELDSLDPVSAAPLTDAGLTAYRAVRRARDTIRPHDAIVLVGIGGLGQYGVQFADMLTGGPVVAVDVDDRALDRATTLGADVTVDAEAETVPQAIRTATDGTGAGAVVDFVGADETLQAGINSLRVGGVLLLAGIGDGELPFAWNPLNPAEVSLATVHWGTLGELRDVIDLAEQGAVQTRTETVGFDELESTFERMAEGHIDGRAVLTP